MAVRLPIPPMKGTGMRNPNSARLGMVCKIFAKPTTQRLSDTRRVSQTPVGIEMPIAINIAISTSSRCSAVNPAISLARPGIRLRVVVILELPVETRKEGAGFIAAGLEKFLGRRQHLQSSAAHQTDTVRQHQSLANIVRHENRSFLKRAPQRKKLALQIHSGDGIERAKRFIKQQHRWIRSQSACPAHTLALAPRELAGVAAGELIRNEIDSFKQFTDSRADADRVPAFELRNQPDVLRYGEMRKQARFLDNVTDPAAQVNGVPRGCGGALDQ